MSFDSKFDSAFEGFDSKMDTAFDGGSTGGGLRGEIDNLRPLGGMDGRFEQAFDRFDQKFEDMDAKFNGITTNATNNITNFSESMFPDMEPPNCSCSDGRFDFHAPDFSHLEFFDDDGCLCDTFDGTSCHKILQPNCGCCLVHCNDKPPRCIVIDARGNKTGEGEVTPDAPSGDIQNLRDQLQDIKNKVGEQRPPQAPPNKPSQFAQFLPLIAQLITTLADAVKKFMKPKEPEGGSGSSGNETPEDSKTVKELKDKITKLEGDKKTKDEEIKKLNDKIEELRKAGGTEDEVKKLETERDALKGKIKELTDNITKLREEFKRETGKEPTTPIPTTPSPSGAPPAVPGPVPTTPDEVKKLDRLKTISAGLTLPTGITINVPTSHKNATFVFAGSPKIVTVDMSKSDADVKIFLEKEAKTFKLDTLKRKVPGGITAVSDVTSGALELKFGTQPEKSVSVIADSAADAEKKLKIESLKLVIEEAKKNSGMHADVITALTATTTDGKDVAIAYGSQSKTHTVDISASGAAIVETDLKKEFTEMRIDEVLSTLPPANKNSFVLAKEASDSIKISEGKSSTVATLDHSKKDVEMHDQIKSITQSQRDKLKLADFPDTIASTPEEDIDGEKFKVQVDGKKIKVDIGGATIANVKLHLLKKDGKTDTHDPLPSSKEVALTQDHIGFDNSGEAMVRAVVQHNTKLQKLEIRKSGPKVEFVD